MLATILRHELRSLIADRSLWIVIALFAGIVGYALYNGVSWVRFQEQTLETVILEEETGIEELREALIATENGESEGGGSPNPAIPGAVAAAGIRYATLPPGPLAAFSVGQSDIHPYYIRVSSRDDARSLVRNGELENPTNLLAGRFDLAFAIVYLIPLLILALTYNLLSGEREAGTLGMVTSHPVSLQTLAAGKGLLRAGLVIGLTLSFAILGSVVLGAIDHSNALSRFALWAIVISAYTLFWVSLALAVGSLGHSSAWSATALLTAWLGVVVVAPSAIHLAATILHPLPSRVEMVQAMRVASDEVNAAGNALLEQYFLDHPEMSALAGDADIGDSWTRSWTVQQEISQRTAPVQDHFETQFARRQQLVSRYRFLSPALVVQEALNDLSGTGTARFALFRESVEAFHGEFTGFFLPRILQREQLTSADYLTIPRFSPPADPKGEIGLSVFAALAALLLPTALLTIVAYRRLRHYPVVT